MAHPCYAEPPHITFQDRHYAYVQEAIGYVPAGPPRTAVYHSGRSSCCSSDHSSCSSNPDALTEVWVRSVQGVDTAVAVALRTETGDWSVWTSRNWQPPVVLEPRLFLTSVRLVRQKRGFAVRFRRVNGTLRDTRVRVFAAGRVVAQSTARNVTSRELVVAAVSRPQSIVARTYSIVITGTRQNGRPLTLREPIVVRAR